MIHRGAVFREQAMPLQVRLGNVVEIPAAGLRAEVHIPRRLFDRFQTHALIFDELHRNLRDPPDNHVRARDLGDGVVAVLRQPF